MRKLVIGLAIICGTSAFGCFDGVRHQINQVGYRFDGALSLRKPGTYDWALEKLKDAEKLNRHLLNEHLLKGEIVSYDGDGGNFVMMPDESVEIEDYKRYKAFAEIMAEEIPRQYKYIKESQMREERGEL